ncbi:MAG: Fe-S cluster assembly protein SufD [Hyphomicrobium sp.]
MKTKAEQALTEQFESHAGQLPGSSAVKDARRAAIVRFGVSGLPHRRIEEWKYTDLRNAMKDALPLNIDDAAKVTIADLIVALGPLAHVDAYRIVFVNGRCRTELSDLDGAKGLEVKPLAGALTGAPDNVAAGLAASKPESDAVATLNTAFMTDGAVVRIAARAKPAKPLLIAFLRTGAEGRFTAVRNVISAGDGCEATLIEAHVALPGATAEGQINALTELSLADDATIVHVKVAADFGKTVHLANWNVSLGAKATYRGFQFTQGQGLARNQIFAVYKGEGGKLDISGAYLARGTEHVDTTLIVDHAVPRCESRELFKGVLDGAARGIFQGKVIVRPDAQKTDGKQMSQALMLSPDAEFDSKPELEIYADDVVCGHGTTSAELDEDLLFYCKSRGIPDNEARALLIESFIGEALDKVEHDVLRGALQTLATDWLAAGATKSRS